MLGKILYNDKIHLARFENNILDIFADFVFDNQPEFENVKINNENILYAYMENGDIFFFNIIDCELEIEKYNIKYFRYKNINYFKYKYELARKDTFYGKDNFFSFQEIIFEDGVLIPMLSFIDDDNYNFESNLTLSNDMMINFEIFFEICDALEENILNYNNLNLLAQYQNCIKKYRMRIKFQTQINLNELDSIIKCILKFLYFLNANNKFSFSKIRVNFGFDLEYYCNYVNYDTSYIKRYSFLKNFNKKNIKILFEEIQNPKYDLSFLNVFSCEKINYYEVYDLAKSIDSMCSNPKESKSCAALKKENEMKNKLHDTIKLSIKKIEEEYNDKFNDDYKNFIIGSSKLENFRKKVADILTTFNDFNKNYNFRQFSELSQDDISSISETIQKLRNTIHGKDNADLDDNLYLVYFVAIAFYVNMFLKIEASDNEFKSSSAIYNLISNNLLVYKPKLS